MATTYLGLTLPTVLDPIGAPAWATTINANFNLIDAHDHTTNKGTKVPVAGLNLNADLDLSNLYRLKRAYSVGLLSQSAAITGDTGSIQSVAGDFYWINSAGTAVKITNGSGLNLSSLGTIGGDYGGTDPASVFYTNSTKTFSFTQDSGITGHIACGNIFIYESVASGKYIQLKPKAALAANIDLQLPSTLPAATSVLTITSAGVIEAGASTDSINNISKQIIPIGSIIPFYDYNGALTFDTDYWAYCNGQTKTIGGSSRTLPDLSNRYLVGFGTEGGADIGSASWSTTVVGNASHARVIAQAEMPIHDHTGAAHTHTFSDSFSGTTGAPGSWGSPTGSGGANYLGHTHSFSGSVSGTTSSTTPTYGGNNHAVSLGTAFNIQPRSISVRYIMRIA